MDAKVNTAGIIAAFLRTVAGFQLSPGQLTGLWADFHIAVLAGISNNKQGSHDA